MPANAGDTRDMLLIPGLGRSSEERNGNLLQYSCLGNPMDRETWQAVAHREAPILWAPNVGSRLTGKDPNVG